VYYKIENKHHTHTTVLQLFGFCQGQPGWAGTRRNIHPENENTGKHIHR